MHLTIHLDFNLQQMSTRCLTVGQRIIGSQKDRQENNSICIEECNTEYEYRWVGY